MKKKILVTGASGFIGMHLTQHLIALGYEVIGIDNLNAYYAIELKSARLSLLQQSPAFQFFKIDVADSSAVLELFAEHQFSEVIHLAAQAGVRYSLIDPMSYQRSNLAGFTSILEACRKYPVRHLMYASSSSVYGDNSKVPFSETDRVDQPVSFYAATKRANEVMAQSYSHLFGIPSTGLRFFTVYGPWGRPDMAYWMFTENLLKNLPITVYGEGKLSRDFTYCADIVDAISRLVDLAPGQVQGEDVGKVPHRILNIGNSDPQSVNELIGIIEKLTQRTAIRVEKPLADGDVERTFADARKLESLTGFKPTTSLEQGLAHFVAWYRDFYKL